MRVQPELSVPLNLMIDEIVPEHEHAEQRADDEAVAAGEQRAADGDGGDGVELHADGVQRVARLHRVERVQHAAERRHRSH